MTDAPPPSLLITPDLRRRLQQQYEEAKRLADHQPPSYTKTHDLLADCLRNDPGNILYLDALIANLRRWKPVTRRSWLLNVFADRSFEKAAQAKDWNKVLQLAPEALRANPWNRNAFVALADACEALRLDDAHLRYLMAAEANPSDPHLLRRLARELTRQGRFDQAIPVWRKLQSAAERDEEVQRALSDLGAPSHLDELEHRQFAIDNSQPFASIESRLLSATDLARHGNFDLAEKILQDAQSAAGSDLRVFEAREELQLARSRHRLAIARRRAESDTHPRAKELVAELEAEHSRHEIEILNVRCERLPGELALRLELARRLKQAGNYSGAIQRLEEVRHDPQLAPAALIELGECWQHLRQFAKALDFYREAAESALTADESLKLALYRTGVLAAALQRSAEARQTFEKLLAIDPAFKDARQRLDNLP